ncbi:MAG: glycosyltransferase family 4 protein [Acidobacteriota bacterium]
MRILMTTDTVGGVWTFTLELAAGLLERGCFVRLVSFGRLPGAAHHEQCAALAEKHPRRFSFVPSEIPLEWMQQNGRVLEQGSQLLQREAALFCPDLIHSNEFCFGALHAAIPCVITAHSDVLSWAKACRLDGLPSSEWLERYIAMVQAGLLAADAVAAPTQWMLHALAETFALPRHSAVVPNGRTIPSSRSGATATRAVTAGRLWDEAKAINTLAHVESTMPIAIAGEGRPECSASWINNSHLDWKGQLSEPEMMRLFCESSVYLCLSKYEPFGLAALEAALCGCAVVARDIPSLREVWRDAALYFHDACELTGLLRRLQSDPVLLRRAQMMANGRAKWFTRDRMVDGYLGLFGSVLQISLREEHAA